jgi:hypothetical protein
LNHPNLQSVNLDLSKAIQHKDAVLKTLTEMRCTKTADEIYSNMEAMLKENDLTPMESRPKRNKRKRMDDYMVDTTTGQREEMSGSDAMRVRLFYPTIDRMITEMSARFSPQCDNVMLGINACNPSSETFLNINDLRRIATHYNMEIFEPEVAVARNYIKAQQTKEDKKFTMEKVYSLLDAFETLKKIFQLALTVPVTSCSCERSFSCLRRVKTWLRTKMTQERLDHLSVLAIERETYTACTDDELVSAFNSMKRRRCDI